MVGHRGREAKSGDMRVLTRDFYKQFYQVELSDAQLDRLLAGTRGRN